MPATPSPNRTILLTGATGFVGMAVLRRLLADGHHVACVVRATDDEQADARLRAALAQVDAPPTGRAFAVAGDVTAPRLGLGDRHDELAARTTTIVHGAASIAFELPLDEARAINVQGVRRVLEFAAAAAPRLERLVHVSTAYVAGDRRGLVREDDEARGAFRNTYEQTKHEAEQLVRATDLPWTIARPSIVVGESDTGWTSSFNVLYAPLRAFAAGAYPVVPARRRSPVDVVSVDYVADAVVALAAHPHAARAIVHLTAGERASTVGEIMALTTAGMEHRAPRLVPAALWPIVYRVVMRRSPRSARRLLDRSQMYFPYFAMRLRFDDARARELLDPLGIEPLPLDAYFDRLITFARAARWGRRPLGRADALELAGDAHDVRAPTLSRAKAGKTAPAR